MLYRDDLVFPIEEFERRLYELRQRMVEQELDAMLTTTPENICYLTGFESPGHYYFNSLVVPLAGEPFMVPRKLEDSGVQALTWIERSFPYADHEVPMEKLAAVLKDHGLGGKRIGYEKNCWFFTATQQEQLFDNCREAAFIDSSGIIEAGRLIKSEHEIAIMRKAAHATEAGMRAGVDAVQVGATENDVAAEIHHAMIKAGSEWPSIAPFVASGHRSAIGHATWMGRTIEADEIIMIEIAGCVRRYHAPMMRTGFVGELDDDARKGEHIVQQAVQAMLDAIKPGVRARDADAIGREIIANSDFGGEQGSRSAYSVGIALPPDWGEGHILCLHPAEERLIEENMTFHLLPWVQVPGKGGFSFSETIRVTKDGCEVLTDFPRQLFVR